MLPRRNPTNFYQSNSSLRPASGGGPPLTLDPNNTNFDSSAVNVESPQSEAFPRGIPRPSQPTPLSQLLSGNGRLKRRSTRHNTCETFSSPSNFSQQPPNSVPISALPHAQTPGYPHSVPVGPQQLSGEGVGGFAATPLSLRGSSNDHQHAAAYRNWFDTVPPPNPDADFPRYEPADIRGGIHANLWPIYNKVSSGFDERRLQKWYTELDVLLLFVSVPGSS